MRGIPASCLTLRARQDMSIILDPPKDLLDRDYKSFAERSGLTPDIVQWLDSQKIAGQTSSICKILDHLIQTRETSYTVFDVYRTLCDMGSAAQTNILNQMPDIRMMHNGGVRPGQEHCEAPSLPPSPSHSPSHSPGHPVPSEGSDLMTGGTNGMMSFNNLQAVNKNHNYSHNHNRNSNSNNSSSSMMRHGGGQQCYPGRASSGREEARGVIVYNGAGHPPPPSQDPHHHHHHHHHHHQGGVGRGPSEDSFDFSTASAAAGPSPSRGQTPVGIPDQSFGCSNGGGGLGGSTLEDSRGPPQWLPLVVPLNIPVDPCTTAMEELKLGVSLAQSDRQQDAPLLETHSPRQQGAPLLETHSPRQQGAPLLETHSPRQQGAPPLQADIHRQQGTFPLQADADWQHRFPMQNGTNRQLGAASVQSGTGREQQTSLERTDSDLLHCSPVHRYNNTDADHPGGTCGGAGRHADLQWSLRASYPNSQGLSYKSAAKSSRPVSDRDLCLHRGNACNCASLSQNQFQWPTDHGRPNGMLGTQPHDDRSGQHHSRYHPSAQSPDPLDGRRGKYQPVDIQLASSHDNRNGQLHSNNHPSVQSHRQTRNLHLPVVDDCGGPSDFAGRRGDVRPTPVSGPSSIGSFSSYNQTDVKKVLSVQSSYFVFILAADMDEGQRVDGAVATLSRDLLQKGIPHVSLTQSDRPIVCLQPSVEQELLRVAGNDPDKFVSECFRKAAKVLMLVSPGYLRYADEFSEGAQPAQTVCQERIRGFHESLKTEFYAPPNSSGTMRVWPVLHMKAARANLPSFLRETIFYFYPPGRGVENLVALVNTEFENSLKKKMKNQRNV